MRLADPLPSAACRWSSLRRPLLADPLGRCPVTALAAYVCLCRISSEEEASLTVPLKVVETLSAPCSEIARRSFQTRPAVLVQAVRAGYRLRQLGPGETILVL